MKNRFTFLLLLMWCLQLHAGTPGDWEKLAANPDFLHRSVKKVTDIIVHDIYSPPVASRIYAYTTIAAYEAAIPSSENYQSLAGQLQGLTVMTTRDSGRSYCHSLASVNALLLVAQSMIISEEKITAFREAILAEFRLTGMPDSTFRNSVAFGQKIASEVLAWAAQDRYKQTRSLAKYAVLNDAGSWKPTPPAYMKAIEPSWGKLRTFLIDSLELFKPVPPTPFSADTNSRFYKEAKEVEIAGSQLTAEQIEIANFWDCNPFKMNVNGHVMFATKKISPGGHWINITALVCKQSGRNFIQAAEAYAAVSIVLADGFISCWEEKFRSKVIRPETYINQYISQSWMPLLQTPPFPEYTSGHSVISAAAAVVLSKLFGDDFSFADSTEVEFGIPVRHFKSFKHAADEAAISRFYGGIHYMPSIVNGMTEGDKLGRYVAERLVTRKERIAHSASLHKHN